jgi:hypothetical protein
MRLSLINDGGKAVRVREVKPTCSCIHVAPQLAGRDFVPGERMEIEVSMSSGRAMGLLSKFVEIHTDDAVVRVPSRMHVFTGIEQNPRQVRFEGVVGGTPVTQNIELVWEPSRPAESALDLVVVGVSAGGSGGVSHDAHFQHELQAISRGVLLRLTLLPDHPEGRIWATLHARLNGQNFELPISGEMFRGIRHAPAYLDFNRADVSVRESFIKECRLESTDGRPFRIVSIEPRLARSSVPGLDLTVTSLAEQGGTAHVVRARLRAPTPAELQGPFSGTVTVFTDHPERPKVELGVYGSFLR